MPQSFLIFDFGVNEEAAQQARHRIDGWRQGFRLDKKLQLKFERKELEPKQDTASVPSPKEAKPRAKPKAAGEADAESRSSPAAQSEIRLIVRLDFSDHEKLSHRRWLERIPSEGAFKAAKPKVVRSGDPEFAATAERFDSLDHAPRSERTGLKV
ncbi:MAG: hypothetical protein LAN18_00035 [Acidobacteriia bacterium]|nr:hypothetical protein [Terriglobia bacterium]